MRFANPAAMSQRTAAQVVSLLAAKGLALTSSHVDTLTPPRLAAMNQIDFVGSGAALDHLLRAASTPKLLGGTSGIDLATDLFGLLGHARVPQKQVDTRCYGRTSHTIFTMHHPGEFARLIVDLATTGTTKLANGETAEWNIASTPDTRQLNVTDVLWAGLTHAAKDKALPNGRVTLRFPGLYAFRGEMANLWTRLTGENHVNVDGRAPNVLAAMREILPTSGPLLAEYEPHGGSLAGFDLQGLPLSMEVGRPVPVRIHDTHINNYHLRLGYVAAPLEQVRAQKLEVIEYSPSDESGYMKWS